MINFVGRRISVESGSMLVGPGTNGTLVQCANMDVVLVGFIKETCVVRD